MSYLDDVAAAIRAELVERPGDSSSPQLLRLYAVLLLGKGETVTAADVHNAWAAWMQEHQPSHEAIRPFNQLDGPTKEADNPFVEAIRRAARALQS